MHNKMVEINTQLYILPTITSENVDLYNINIKDILHAKEKQVKK